MKIEGKGGGLCEEVEGAGEHRCREDVCKEGEEEEEEEEDP